MAIRVTCPGCHKRFQVSDQFAGKSGPCPNCKTVIRVPTKDEEVKIHEPSRFGAGVRGATATKLIFREDAKFRPVVALSIVGAALVVVIVTVVLGRAGFFEQQTVLKSAIGLLLVSPPLVIAGYSFLRDEEDLRPFRGRALYLRVGICSALYIALWGLFYGYQAKAGVPDMPWEWAVPVAVLLFLGVLFGAHVCLELDVGRGFFHYAFYLFVTVLLRWMAGMGWVWQIPKEPLS